MIPYCHFCCFYRLRSLHASTLVLLSFGMYIHVPLWTLIVHSYFWDSPWNLIVFVADGTITVWCILYTNNRILMVCEIPRSVGVACSPKYTSKLLKGVGCDRARCPYNCRSFFWWGSEYWYSCWHTHTNKYVVVCYELSYWPARSIVGHPAGAQAYCCQWVLLHGRLTPLLHWLHVSAVDDIMYGPRCGTNTK